MLKLILLQKVIQKRLLIQSKYLCLSLGAPRVDFSRFLGASDDIKKRRFFDIAQKRPRMQNQSTLGRPSVDFGSKNMTFQVPFCTDVQFFRKRAKMLQMLCFPIVFKFFGLLNGLNFQRFFIQFSCFFWNRSRRAFF